MAYGIDVSNILGAFGQLQQANAQRRAAQEAKDARRRSGISAVTTTAGSIIGGIYGGPMGAAAGGAIGGAVGGMVGGESMSGGQVAQHGANIYGAYQTEAQTPTKFEYKEEEIKSGDKSLGTIVKKVGYNKAGEVVSTSEVSPSQLSSKSTSTGLKTLTPEEKTNLGFKPGDVVQEDPETKGLKVIRKEDQEPTTPKSQLDIDKSNELGSKLLGQLGLPKKEDGVVSLAAAPPESGVLGQAVAEDRMARKQALADGIQARQGKLNADQLNAWVDKQKQQETLTQAYEDQFATMAMPGERLDVPPPKIPANANLGQVREMAKEQMNKQRVVSILGSLKTDKTAAGEAGLGSEQTLGGLENAIDRLSLVDSDQGKSLKGTLEKRLEKRIKKNEKLAETKEGKIKLEKDLRGEYIAQTKKFEESSSQFDRIKTAATQKEPSGTSDLSLIFAYMKMLDPGSVVRESEFKTAENAQGIPDKINTWRKKIIRGDKLSPEARKRFLGMAEQLYSADMERKNKLMSRYGDLSDNYGLKKENVVFDLPKQRTDEQKQKIPEERKENAKKLLNMVGL